MEKKNNNSNNSNGNNADIELDRFRQIINNKINEKKNQIFLLYSMAYNNNNVQYEINCLRWVLGKTNQRQIQMNDNLIQVIDSPAQTNKNTIIGRTNPPRISKIIPNLSYFHITSICE
jgi:CRISPR/Cas system CSM-associated protein Csm2 small subunit